MLEMKKDTEKSHKMLLLVSHIAVPDDTAKIAL